MPAESKSQFRFMAFCSHADHPPKDCPRRAVALEFTKGKGLYERLPEKKRPLRDRMVR